MFYLRSNSFIFAINDLCYFNYLDMSLKKSFLYKKLVIVYLFRRAKKL